MRKAMLASILLFIFKTAYTQTVLQPGDIAIVTLNGDSPDNFEFVTFINISSGTEIHFTDKGWDGSVLADNEGIISYTAQQDINAGTVITYSGSDDASFSSSGSYNISVSGDNCLIYQGTSADPSFLFGAGIAKTSTWISSGGISSNNSYVPSGLSKENKTIIELGAGDNYQYDISAGKEGNAEVLLSLIGNADNWQRNDADPFSGIGSDFIVSDQSLSVSLSGFTAERSGIEIILKWTTESETENAGFSIYRSIGGGAFQKLADHSTHDDLMGAGNSSIMHNYIFRDRNIPRAAQISYMLADTEYNGKTIFHDEMVVTIDIKKEDKDVLKIYPNPFNDLVKIKSSDLGRDNSSKLLVYSLDGRLKIRSDSRRIQRLGEEFRINFENMAAGVYILSLHDGISITNKKLLYLP